MLYSIDLIKSLIDFGKEFFSSFFDFEKEKCEIKSQTLKKSQSYDYLTVFLLEFRVIESMCLFGHSMTSEINVLLYM